MYERFVDIYTQVDIDFALAFVSKQARTSGKDDSLQTTTFVF